MRRGLLAAVLVEMAEQGRSTAGLARDASESAVRAALAWDEAGWRWDRYGPLVMAAVRAGIPVAGANLPRAGLRASMADATLDTALQAAAWQRQREDVRSGHCDLLPESQLGPMTRVQVARDRTMADAVARALVPGRVVLLVAGGAHVLRQTGVPEHLPASVRARVVLALAGEAGASRAAQADQVWRTAALPPQDYCTPLRERMAPRKG